MEANQRFLWSIPNSAQYRALTGEDANKLRDWWTNEGHRGLLKDAFGPQ